MKFSAKVVASTNSCEKGTPHEHHFRNTHRASDRHVAGRSRPLDGRLLGQAHGRRELPRWLRHVLRHARRDGPARHRRRRSIGVSEPNLNGHLLSPDFFDAERNPQLSFDSTAIRVEGDKLDIDGELTIKGTTKPVKIAGTVTGPVDASATRLASASSSRRSSTGRHSASTGTRPLPTGGFAVGNDVKLVAELELVEEA